MPIKSKYECLKQNPKRYKKFLKDKREFSKRYRFKHPLKYLCTKTKTEGKLDLTVTPFDLWKIVKRQRLRCSISGQKLTTENISLDHIQPLVNGGSKSLNNIQFTTKEINLAKHVMSTENFINLCEIVYKNKLTSTNTVLPCFNRV